MQKDNKERISGDTVEADRTELAEVRASLVALSRIKKGLPPEPVSLDVDILSQLPDSPVIYDPIGIQEPKVVPIDISRLSAEHSVVGLSAHRERLKKIERKKAA